MAECLLIRFQIGIESDTSTYSPLLFQTANNNYLRAQADEMNSLFKYLIKQAVVRYYNGTDYINQ